MIKKVLLASIFSLALSGAAAAKAPSTAAECQALVKTTFTSLAKKKMSADQTKKAEDMLDQLVSQCSAKKFGDAEKTAASLKAMAG